jgi:hypothetical protein
MTRKLAKEIAETITNEQLQAMFDAAKVGITDWKTVSKINKGISKGAAWNILVSDFYVDDNLDPIIKFNMVREFGDFLDDSFKSHKKN